MGSGLPSAAKVCIASRIRAVANSPESREYLIDTLRHPNSAALARKL
jgi:hypothetical protein